MNQPYINNSENMLHSEEIKRLKQQSDLLKKYDKKIYSKVFAKVFSGVTSNILDLGSGSGYFFFSRLDDFIKNSHTDYKYIGVDINLEKYIEVVQGYKKRKNVCFIECDIDITESVPPLPLVEAMEKMGIIKFDLINMSWVALHLTNIDNLLKILKNLLSENGIIVIEDIDDRLNKVSPCSMEGDFKKLYDICDKEGFSGNRKSGLVIKKHLTELGYTIINSREDGLSTETKGVEKRDFWDTYFEMIYQDMKMINEDRLFEEKYSGFDEFEKDYKWMTDNWEKIRETFYNGDFSFVFGVVLYVALSSKK